MKNALLAIVSLCTLAVTGCNSIADKEALVARVNGEPIYKEDYAFMMRVGNIVPNTEQMRKASGSLFSRKALYTVALRNNPEIKEELAVHNNFVENYYDKVLLLQFHQLSNQLYI